MPLVFLPFPSTPVVTQVTRLMFFSSVLSISLLVHRTLVSSHFHSNSRLTRLGIHIARLQPQPFCPVIYPTVTPHSNCYSLNKPQFHHLCMFLHTFPSKSITLGQIKFIFHCKYSLNLCTKRNFTNNKVEQNITSKLKTMEVFLCNV